MVSSDQRKRLCFVATSPLTVQVFLHPHLAALSANYDVTVMTNLDGYSVARFGLSAVDFGHIGFVRTLSPLSDILVIARLYRIFYRGSFDAVVTVTPKAGLTATLASFLARVPTRIHWFTGQVWATQKFPMRTLLKLADRVIARATTAGLVDGLSQLNFLIDQGVGDKEKLGVLLNGSICGVDGQRFRPDEKKRAQVRAQLGIPEKSPVFLFLGRLTRDKGVLDLAASFASMESASRPQIIFVGPDEGRLALTHKKPPRSPIRCLR